MASGITSRTIHDSFRIYYIRKPTKEELKRGLQTWCQEKEGTPEYEPRLETATLIEECCTSESETLILAGRNLTSLPDEIGALESLQYLDLQDNQLTTLPMSLAKLVYLNQLILDNNPMGELPFVLCCVPKSCSISTKGCGLDLSILERPSTNMSGSLSRLATSWEPNLNWEMDFNDR